ncbi:hypothetical protein BTUL_0023g00120 [Botrytis tulipae]|uniref:Uncharacterized protein n=1 Tax=Botrytis tulipae TaxID=87230 RepID=A0A4Z1EZT1_9HELO|nr:hypothetical protein BTUL_0023g00120 [Botrytis tulipae]
MNSENRSGVIYFEIEELSPTEMEEEILRIALQGDRDFDDPPIVDPALEEPVIDDPPVEVPLLQLRPQPPQPQPQSFRYSNIITLIQIIELIALIAIAFFFLSDYFSPKPTPTRTGPPPPTPAGR